MWLLKVCVNFLFINGLGDNLQELFGSSMLWCLRTFGYSIGLITRVDLSYENEN